MAQEMTTNLKKGVVFLATSEDGFIATEDGGVEWLHQFGGEDDGGFGEFLASCQAMVMGRNTFDTVAGMEGGPWPYGNTPVYVVTSQHPENVAMPDHLKQ